MIEHNSWNSHIHKIATLKVTISCFIAKSPLLLFILFEFIDSGVIDCLCFVNVKQLFANLTSKCKITHFFGDAKHYLCFY